MHHIIKLKWVESVSPLNRWTVKKSDSVVLVVLSGQNTQLKHCCVWSMVLSCFPYLVSFKGPPPQKWLCGMQLHSRIHMTTNTEFGCMLEFGVFCDKGIVNLEISAQLHPLWLILLSPMCELCHLDESLCEIVHAFKLCKMFFRIIIKIYSTTEKP